MNVARAVVIGATGYVGSAVTKSLGKHGISSITCTSRNIGNAQWLKDLAADTVIQVVPLQLCNEADDSLLKTLRRILFGADAVFFCAGFEEQSPSTIDFMVNNEPAKAEGVGVVVLTSSGGSTNPPGGLDSAVPKSELLHFSDPDEQIGRGRFSPAAKTLMEIAALAAVGRNHANEIVDAALAHAPSTPRLVVLNPNLILGPPLDPGPAIKGNSLPWMLQILKKERMAEAVPNDSMSIIDVRDLAALHVRAAFSAQASGRYFGVHRSFTWKEILEAFGEVSPDYAPPPLTPGVDYDATVPTQFDHTRTNSLGVTLRPLQATLKDLVDFFRAKGAI